MKPDIGKRIQLVHTGDKHTKLKRGDTGTITDITDLPKNIGGTQIWVKWDSGSNLALIEGIDRYIILD